LYDVVSTKLGTALRSELASRLERSNPTWLEGFTAANSSNFDGGGGGDDNNNNNNEFFVMNVLTQQA
jgi:hypothetical protein